MRRSTDITVAAEPTNGHYAPDWMPQESLDLQQTLAMLYRRRWVLIGTFLCVVIAVAAYTWLSRPVYKATAQILIDAGRGNSGGQADLPVLNDLLGMTRARSVETQAEIIKSAAIQEQAKKGNVSAYRQLVGKVDVQVSKNTDIVSVSALSYRPDDAVTVANAVCEAYIERSMKDNRQQTKSAADYAEKELKKVRERLDEAQTELREYKRRNVTIDLAAESSQKVSALSGLEAALDQTRAEQRAAQSELASLTSLTSTGGDRPGATVLAGSATAEAIRANLVKLELDLAEARQEYTEGSPEVRRAERQLRDAQEQLRLEATRSVARDRAPIQTRVWSLDARAAALSQAAGRLRSDLSRLPEREYNLAQLTTEMRTLQQTYDMLNERYQALLISHEARGANAEVISGALKPDAPVRPRKAVNMMLAVILGAVLAVGAAAAVERLDTRVHTDEDTEKLTGVPVLAYIPLIKSESERSLAAGGSRTNPLLESYRMLRTNLLLSSIDEPARMLAITSTEPGEGKSLTCVNLAVAMALDNKRVILVDGDLRHPTAHRFFGLSKDIGLTSVVAGDKTLEEAVQETKIPGLRLLASGPLPPNPPELLNSRASHAVFQQLLEMADFVVVDTPPALVMADAHVIASVADGVIMVVSTAESVKQPLQHTAGLLRQTGARLLGSIMNKLEAGRGGYYGYYYPYSHYRYSKYYKRYFSSAAAAGDEPALSSGNGDDRPPDSSKAP